MISGLTRAVRIICCCSRREQHFERPLQGLLTLWLSRGVCEIVDLMVDSGTKNFFRISAVLAPLKLRPTISPHSYGVNSLRQEELPDMGVNGVRGMVVDGG